MTEEAPTEQAQASEQTFAVPEAYKEKPWVEKIKSSDDLWKTLDNAQGLIGKKTFSPPPADAPQEEWDKFIGTLRPESPDKYQFSPIEGLPEGVDLTEASKNAAALFHKHGITPKQADGLFKDYVQTLLTEGKTNAEKSAEQSKALDAEFDKLTKEHFGDQFEIKAKTAMELINKRVPETLRSAFKDAENNPKLLAGIVAAMDGAQQEIEAVKKQYGAEGKLTTGDTSGGMTTDQIRDELSTLRLSNEYRDFMHPKNKETTERVNLLSDMLRRSHKS